MPPWATTAKPSGHQDRTKPLETLHRCSPGGSGAGRLTGISSFGIQERDDRRVAAIRLRPDADEAAIRAAADPIPVEIEHVDAVRTVRSQRPATDREPAHRALTLVGAPMRLAARRGTLRRTAPTDDCDVLVGETRVHLIPEHRIGPRRTPRARRLRPSLRRRGRPGVLCRRVRPARTYPRHPRNFQRRRTARLRVGAEMHHGPGWVPRSPITTRTLMTRRYVGIVIPCLLPRIARPSRSGCRPSSTTHSRRTASSPRPP